MQSEQEKSELMIQQSRELIVEFATALHTYGLAAHELESAMTQIANVLGESASYFATPTSIFITFGQTSQQRTLLLRVTPGDINLGKLSQLYALQQALVNGELSVTASLRQLRSLLADPPSFHRWETVAAYGGAPASAAVIFGGLWPEVVVAGVIGLLVGFLSVLVSGKQRLQRLFLPLASVLTALTAFGIASVVPVMSSVVTVSALIILIPGLSLTIAMNELAMQNLASGTARLMGAFSQLLIIGFGVAMGRSLVHLWVRPEAFVVDQQFSLFMFVVALVVAAASFTVLFQAMWQDYLWILLASMTAYFCSRYAVIAVGPLAGPSIAAATLGGVSSLVSRYRRQPEAITLVPGLLLLVPGSLGFRSVAELMDKQLLESFESLFTMVLISAAIVSGLLFSNVVFPDRR